MRELLKGPKIVVSPGVYDGYSVRLAEKMGFATASTTGAGIANARLSVPDVGIMTLTENVDACRFLARSVSIPMMADADTGYGNAITVYHVVRLFEELAERGLKVDYRSVWNFVHAEKLSFKKNRARQRTGASRRGAPASAVAGPSKPD